MMYLFHHSPVKGYAVLKHLPRAISKTIKAIKQIFNYSNTTKFYSDVDDTTSLVSEINSSTHDIQNINVDFLTKLDQKIHECTEFSKALNIKIKEAQHKYTFLNTPSNIYQPNGPLHCLLSYHSLDDRNNVESTANNMRYHDTSVIDTCCDHQSDVMMSHLLGVTVYHVHNGITIPVTEL